MSKRLKRLLLYLRDLDVMKTLKESLMVKSSEPVFLKLEVINIDLRKDH